ncbi:hypothetical protein BIW11_02874 [Tropilaelaps mercedesae]|uniref:Uncharacterized protein n=1 Tax=Tropilaelaps mercedesae TaxID=418985 RepID=A0A1V9XWD9_9ACAR|nr:hypothetical protein BIW11_02874 [Tropilaelaps mercedesae]
MYSMCIIDPQHVVAVASKVLDKSYDIPLISGDTQDLQPTNNYILGSFSTFLLQCASYNDEMVHVNTEQGWSVRPAKVFYDKKIMQCFPYQPKVT